ncbi:hypothetical protein B0H12DRAFT_1155930 [Mycena haematopus]|nr:hypothetical protein B0H12DRAFT_1155930 [Mycena haematopus]
MTTPPKLRPHRGFEDHNHIPSQQECLRTPLPFHSAQSAFLCLVLFFHSCRSLITFPTERRRRWVHCELMADTFTTKPTAST